MKFPRVTIAKHTRTSNRKGVVTSNRIFFDFSPKNDDKDDNNDDDDDNVDDDNDNDDDSNDDDGIN